MKSLIEKISVDKIQKKRVKDRLDGGKKKKKIPLNLQDGSVQTTNVYLEEKLI